jgi:tyrosyl-tRNA synthetase
MPSSDFLRDATARGFVHQCTDPEGLQAALNAGVVTAYIGFDCTADSLHVGSLVQIMLLRLLQRHGHRPLVLMGGGTTRIGDPSGKDESRQLLSDETIRQNMAGIRRVFSPFLTFGSGPSDAIMANNADWLDALGYIPLLRDVGIHFSVNRMLSFDSVKLRLEREQPLTFLEFNYMILQSYDFRELFRRHGVTLQMGGSDQWGNIVSGADLIRRTDAGAAFGLTTPLIATASGEKMGKTARGAVWLTADRIGPYDYFHFWRDTADADVGRFLRLFTDLPLDEIARLEALGGAEINDAKKILATEATALAHGRENAEQAAEYERLMFERPVSPMMSDNPRHAADPRAAAHQLQDATAPGGSPLTLRSAPAFALPSISVPAADLSAGIPAFRLLVEAGLAASNSEARRLIRGGGARVNDSPIQDESHLISNADLRDGAIKLSAGRKQHRLVRVG